MKLASILPIVLIFAILSSSAVLFAPGQSGDAPALPDGGTRAIEPGTTVINDISTDTTWDEAGMPWRVKASIELKKNVKLTIDPGVEVIFYSGVTFTIDGELAAVGSAPYDIIQFKPYVDSPAGWSGLKFTMNSTNCVLEHVNFRFAESAVNCTQGSSPVIRNCEFYSSFFYSVYCALDADPVIEDCFFNISTYAGLICNNNSNPTVRGNKFDMCYYGVISYSSPVIQSNEIRSCSYGVFLINSTAHIYNNKMAHCIDGIFSFYSDAKIENNTIISSASNGTRFWESNAIFLNNTMEYNDVGVDIPYNSRGVLLNMSGNTVNGQDVNDIYKWGLEDAVISGLFIDSGQSVPGKSYFGMLTAQGSIPLYDCHNITFRDCRIRNAVSCIYALGSDRVYIYNSTFESSRRADVWLDEMSSAFSFNGSVDPYKVHIEDDGSYLQSHGEMQVRVWNFTNAPVEGASVKVSDLNKVLHNVTTNASGLTPWLLVKEKRVTPSGIINYTLMVEASKPGFTFGSNPREVLIKPETVVDFTDLGDFINPTINAVNIESGQQGVAVDTRIIITFSEPMNRSSAEEAFSISGNLSGTFSWDGNSMIFTPDANLTFGESYTVNMAETATDIRGNTLEGNSALVPFSFTVVPEVEVANSNTILIAAVVVFLLMGAGAFWFFRKG